MIVIIKPVIDQLNSGNCSHYEAGDVIMLSFCFWTTIINSISISLTPVLDQIIQQLNQWLIPRIVLRTVTMITSVRYFFNKTTLLFSSWPLYPLWSTTIQIRSCTRADKRVIQILTSDRHRFELELSVANSNRQCSYLIAICVGFISKCLGGTIRTKRRCTLEGASVELVRSVGTATPFHSKVLCKGQSEQRMSAQVLSQLNDPSTTIKEESSSSSSVTSSGSDLALLRPPKLSRAVNGSEDLQGEGVHDEISSPSSPVIVYRTNSVSSNCSRDSVVTLKHYDCLLGELRCPGCARPMQSPIYLCKSGHSVCELCTETLCNCPLCKQSFTEIRSVTLEALAEKAYFLCKYSVYGCTVRLPYHLMRWHKERCVYQVGDCFMGKVWGGCKWSGCEIDWIKHCTDFHSEKLFASNEALLYWRYTPKKAKSVLGFFIFQAFGETFNLYHVHDKLRAHSKWTIVCASKDEKAYKNFAFQVEMFVPGDPSRLLIQRHCCHGERDDDVLEEARCVCIGMGDIMRFMSADKVSYYHGLYQFCVWCDYLEGGLEVKTKADR